jgi:hypothetical protein
MSAVTEDECDWGSIRSKLDNMGGYTEGTRVCVAVLTPRRPDGSGTDESGTDESGTDESGTDESGTDGVDLVYHVGPEPNSSADVLKEYYCLLGLGKNAARNGWSLRAHTDRRTTEDLAAHGLVSWVACADDLRTQHMLAAFDNTGVPGFRAFGESMIVAIAAA